MLYRSEDILKISYNYTMYPTPLLIIRLTLDVHVHVLYTTILPFFDSLMSIQKYDTSATDIFLYENLYSVTIKTQLA